mgnify:CR=1 FL=1
MGFANGEGGLFKNWIKTGLSLGSGAGVAFPALLTADNYPSDGAVLTSNIFITVPVPQDVTTSTDLVFKCTNAGGAAGGDIQLARGAPGFDNIVVSSGTQVGSASFNLTMTGTNPRVVFRFATSVPTTTVTMNFLASGTFSGISNMVMCKLSDEAAVDAATIPEDLFYQPYVDFYLALNCKVFRPMGWANTNSNNLSRYAYRVPWQTGLTYQSPRWVSDLWAGTATGTDTYTATRPTGVPATPTDGATIQLQFTNANTSTTVTLDLGGSWGAKAVLAGTGGGAYQVPSINSITAGQLATLVYDSLVDAWTHSSGGLTNNIPVEVRLGFANKCGAHYWHNFPVFYDDASALSEAVYCRDNATAGSVVYMEYSNEPWNPGFAQNKAFVARGLALGFPADNNRRMHGYVGLRIRQIMGQIVTAWNGRTELRGVNAFQAFGPSATTTYQFNGADLNTSLGYTGYNSFVGVNYDTAPNRPNDLCRSISYATYVGGAQTLQFDAQYVSAFGSGLNFSGLTTAADDYASGTPQRMAQALSWLDYDIRQGVKSNGVLGSDTMQSFRLGSPANSAIYGTWSTVASTYSPAKFVECYEGCSCSVVAPSTATCTAIGIDTSYGGTGGKIDNLITGYKMSAKFRQLFADQNNEFMAAANSLTPAWLLVPGASPWGLMQGGNYSTPFASKDALIAFNNTTFGRLR